jgi:hypothetical protein
MARNKEHTLDQIKCFTEELKIQTDRGVALIAAAVLDELLEMLLTARLLAVGRDHHDALFGRGKPLDSFSAKIELGFQLGLYTNATRTQLEMIRAVRNKFAHSIEPLTLSKTEVSSEITSRRVPSANKGPATRGEFEGMFSLLAMNFYGLMDANIRLQSILETHSDHIAQMMQFVVDRVNRSEDQSG